MSNPFQQEQIIKEAYEIAERNEFKLVEHRNYVGRISATSTKAPYMPDVVIKVFDDWRDVVIFFMGYEQLAFEMKFTK